MKKLLGLIGLLVFHVAGAQNVPQARINVTPTTGDLTTIFTIDASQSVNSLGDRQNLEYQFRIDNRLQRSGFSQNPRLSFRAQRTGTITAEVVVRDRRTGATAINSQRYSVRETIQREVQIRVSNTNPQAGDSVTYEAVVFGNNIDRSSLRARWDFNSDGRYETGFQPVLIATDRPSAGRSFPTVEVRFPDGRTIVERGFQLNTDPRNRNQTARTNFVSTERNPLSAPVIEVFPKSREINENTNVTFDGSKTQTLRNSYLEWVVDSRTFRNKEKINYTFKSSGAKTVTLRHCLEGQPESCLETKTDITVESQPNDQYLTLSWNNLSDNGRRTRGTDYALITATDKIRVTVRAQGQSAGNQRFLYRWDFEGDGQWDTDYEAKNSVEHQFDQTGNFIVVVEAIPTFSADNFESLSAILPVYVERNRAPFGDFELRQENNFVGERVIYTAVAQDPESGNLVEVRFDSDADGIWDGPFRNQRSWWWVYDTPGEYNVRMQLRDPQGRLEEISKVMTILPMPQPQTQVKVSHRTQTENMPVLLDGSASIGRKLTYEWTVQGQRSTKLYGPKTNLRLPAGDYQVQLTIRDRLGAQDSVVFPVTFTSNSATARPQTSVTSSPTRFLATATPSNQNTSNIINNLPGARMRNNFILPPEGAPSITSPFQINAGARPVDRSIKSGMRALP